MMGNNKLVSAFVCVAAIAMLLYACTTNDPDPAPVPTTEIPIVYPRDSIAFGTSHVLLDSVKCESDPGRYTMSGLDAGTTTAVTITLGRPTADPGSYTFVGESASSIGASQALLTVQDAAGVWYSQSEGGRIVLSNAAGHVSANTY